MLNARHIFRLCKQSAQCTVTRPSVYFSSSSDDSDSKRPPKKNDGDSEPLDALLNATFQFKPLGKNSKRKIASQLSQKKASPTSFTKSVSSKTAGPYSDDAKPKKMVDSDKSLDDVLKMAYQRNKPDIETKSTEPTHRASGTGPKIDLAVKKREETVSSTELLDRVRKIAQEVAGAAGPKSSQVAEDLIKKLQIATEAKEAPLDFSEMTVEGRSKDVTSQNMDLLRNTIVSEEQLYNITPGQGQPLYRRERSQTESREPWSERPRRVRTHDLDISLYPTTRLEIFNPKPKENQRTKSCLRTYERLEQRDLRLSHSFAPKNWFEECIQWTEEGKLWQFPINNEQGLEEIAKNVSFTEHIFLEDHLEGWCPTFGPVRHFMELVCLGLSKNPYLEVQEKIENIMWYRDYFEKHRELLTAAGALEAGVTKVPALEAQ